MAEPVTKLPVRTVATASIRNCGDVRERRFDRGAKKKERKIATKKLKESRSSRRAKIELTFLGTRGEIKARSRRHFRHSALLIQQGPARIMIDCGTDWLKMLKRVAPTAIVLTHGHGDHAFGLANGAPCPVYATEETIALIARYPIVESRTVLPRVPFAIGGVRFEAFTVQHSLRAPAVGYRISRGHAAFFYVPDLAALDEPYQALHGIDLYVGDGATIVRSMVRPRGHALIGHAPITAQLSWCAAEGVTRAIFTHCGSGIVKKDARRIAAHIKRLGNELGVEASVACDGQFLSL